MILTGTQQTVILPDVFRNTLGTVRAGEKVDWTTVKYSAKQYERWTNESIYKRISIVDVFATRTTMEF